MEIEVLKKLVDKTCSPLYMKELVRRKGYDYRSTSPAEIISCRLSNGKNISLFCKHGGNHTQFAYGHRGGVRYEAKIYEEILTKTPLTTPQFFGAYEECQTGASARLFLLIKFLRAKLLKDHHDPEMFGKAAAWIGSLHRLYESKLITGVKIYDVDYYLIWLERVEKMLPVLQEKFNWLPALCAYFRENLHFFTDTAQTFIHGEFYTKNILVHKGIVYPIDWESAAVGPGEIDLASLIDGWDHKRRDIAIKNYIKSRWPDGKYEEDEFRQRLQLAKIYYFLRWTGEDDEPEFWLKQEGWFKQTDKWLQS